MVGAESSGGWNRWVYFLAVLYACVVAADPGSWIRSFAQRWFALGAALTATLALWRWASALDAAGVDAFEGRGIAIAWRILMGIGGWSWVAAILGISAALVSGRRAVGDLAASGTRRGWPGWGCYAQEAVLPIHVLHMTVLVAVGYFVVWRSANLPIKYVAIVAAAHAGTLLLFDVVRRIPLARFLLGMKPREGSLRSSDSVSS